MEGTASGSATIRVAVVGDRATGFAPQDSIETALAESAGALGIAFELEWFATPFLEGARAAELLHHADAVWCAPGAPYASLDGALAGIRFAREHGRPFLGTCAGFQHAVLEVARDLLGVADAHHAEYGAVGDASPLFIDELLCSLVGEVMTVDLVDDATRAIYGTGEATERYYCRFGLNETYAPALAECGFIVAGRDRVDGTTRIMRLVDHPFFYGTLFVPQTSSSPEHPHPLITSFVIAALRAAGHPRSPRDPYLAGTSETQ